MPDLTFDAPEGFTPPEHLESDDTFQAMATFRIVGDNELELVDIEGYQIGQEDTEGDTEAAKTAEGANVASALQGAGSAAGAEANMGGQTPAGPTGAPAGGAATYGAPAAGSQASFAQQMGARFRRATGRR
jgi:hypothetical protein